MKNDPNHLCFVFGTKHYEGNHNISARFIDIDTGMCDLYIFEKDIIGERKSLHICSNLKAGYMTEEATRDTDGECKWKEQWTRTGQRVRQSKTSGYEWADGHHPLAPTMSAFHNRLGLQRTVSLSSSERICTSPAHNPIQQNRSIPALFSSR